MRSELRTHQDAAQEQSHTPPGAGPPIHDEDETLGHVLRAVGRTQSAESDQKAGFSGTRENASGSPVGAVLGTNPFRGEREMSIAAPLSWTGCGKAEKQ